MTPEQLINVFVIAKSTSLRVYSEMMTPQLGVTQEQIDEIVEEMADMFDMKLECLKMRASLV